MIFWNLKKIYSDFIHTLWKSCTQYCFWVPSFVAIHCNKTGYKTWLRMQSKWFSLWTFFCIFLNIIKEDGTVVYSLHVCSLVNLGNMFFITVSYKLKKQESFSKSPAHVEGLECINAIGEHLFYHLSHDCPHLNLCFSLKLFRNEQDLNFFINGNFYFNSSD